MALGLESVLNGEFFESALKCLSAGGRNDRDRTERFAALALQSWRDWMRSGD